MLELAISMVKSKEMTSAYAEKTYGIPRRTIEKKINGEHTTKPGPRFKLSNEKEENIVKVLVAAADFGSPLTALDLRLVVYEYLKKNNKENLFNGKPPGEWWARNFIDRHNEKLTTRATQNIKRARAEKTVTEFQDYFKNLEESLKVVPPSNILNYDETNVSDDPGSDKCIFRRGVKYPERVMSATKGCISIMFCACADGNMLPPYVVYKSECMWTQWVEGGPENARYNRTKSGWFDTSTFVDWFTTIVVPWAKRLEGPKVIIGDNLASHLNIEVVTMCEQNNIRFVLLPPNSTHLSQPLDVAFFGPLKKCWRRILKNYKIENPKQSALNKAHFPPLLKKLIEDSNLKSKENIVSGFRATGIYPVDPLPVMRKLPEYTESNSYGVDDALLDYLKENRRPNPMKRKSNKKMNVLPGKSVTIVDLTGDDKTEESENQVQQLEEDKEKNTKDHIPKSLNDGKKIKILSNILLPKKYTNKKKVNVDVAKQEKSIKNKRKRKLDAYDGENMTKKPEKNKTNIKSNLYKKKKKKNASETSDSECSVKFDDSSDYNFEDEYNMEEVAKTKIMDRPKTKDRNHQNKINCVKKETKHDFRLKNDSTNDVVVTINCFGNLSDDESQSHSTWEGLNKLRNQPIKDVTLQPKIELQNNMKKQNILFNNINDNETTLEETEQKIVCSHTNEGGKVKTHYEDTTKDENKTLCNDSTTSKQDDAKDETYVEEMNTERLELCIGETVLARYYEKKTWKYYIGEIIEIDILSECYKISYYKTNRQKDGIKFTKPLREDIDSVPHNVIVKPIAMLQISKDPDSFVLMEDADAVYFL